MDREENKLGGRRAHNKWLFSRLEVDKRLRMNLRRRDTWIKRVDVGLRRRQGNLEIGGGWLVVF